MAEIIMVAVDRIAINPFRRLHDYPYVQNKLDALDRSIAEVGLWPSVIARTRDYREYEIAFGHHRLEAAKRYGLKEIPLIVQQLSDEQMLQYMGRENLEDYNANFLIQLESWEAAIKSGFLGQQGVQNLKAIDIAVLLGWTKSRSGERADELHMNRTAEACNAVYALIGDGYQSREEYKDLSVEQALNIAQIAYTRMKQVEQVGKKHRLPTREVEAEKKKWAKAAKDTAAQVREHKVAPRDIRARVAFNRAKMPAPKPSPLFAKYANDIAEYLKRALNNDTHAAKLSEIVQVLPQLSMLEDWEALRRLRVELVNLSERAEAWDRRLEPSREKVVQLRALEQGRAS